MHALVQDRDDADVTIAEPLPVHEVLLVSKDEAIHPELGRDRARGNAAGRDPVKGLEQPLT